ncbi:MAG: HEAT repeat domain-containing protein [Pyrinomonadaceae bacterium MAG19_C2-C3]|nr:HEAT repeat domain-containing protein [Pyrinomonadaceae bacterium MAG19_C2-C3]
MVKLKDNMAAAFDIRPGDGFPLVLLLVHSFAQGTSLIFLETPANTFFLRKFSVEAMPYVYMLTAGISTVLGFGYAKLQARIAPSKLLITTLVVVSISTAAFYLALSVSDSKWVVMGLMVWKDVHWILQGIEFWALAGFLLNVRQGKRLFALVGTGEIVASIFGGLSVPFIVGYLGTLNLVLFSLAGSVLSLVVLVYTLRVFAVRFVPTEDETETKKESKSLYELCKEPYLFLFFSLSLLSYIGFYFVDYVFYDRVESGFPDEQQLASFFGIFFAMLGVVDLISSAFVSGRMLTRYGLSFGLLALPVSIAVTTGSAVTGYLLFGSAAVFLWMIVATKLLDEVIRSSIQAPAFRILYQPLPIGKRLHTQAVRESIVEPVAIGLSGAILLLLTSTLALQAIHLLYIVLIIIAACIVLSVLLRRAYTIELTAALTRKKRFGGHSISMTDQSSFDVIEKSLESANANQVIYCLNLLEENEHPAHETFLLKSLNHTEPEVRRYALKRIEALRVAAAIEPVRQLVLSMSMCLTPNQPSGIEPVRQLVLSDSDANLRGQVLRAMCAIGGDEVFDKVPAFLASTEPEVRKGAMVGLLRSGGIDGVLTAGASLNDLLIDVDSGERKLAAQVLGDVGIFNFYQPLVKLLRDENMEVRKAALTAAGKVKNLNLLPLMLENLSIAAVREAASSALVNFGKDIIPELEAALTSKEHSNALRIRVAQICGRIGGDNALAMLGRNINLPNESVRGHILSALVMCKYKASPAESSKIDEAIKAEVRDATWALIAAEDIGIDEVSDSLIRALKHEVKKNQERIFMLLSFNYHAEPILQAKLNLETDSVEKKAAALEILDNLLAKETRDMIFPLLDDIAPEQRLNRLIHAFPQSRRERAGRIQEIICRSQEQSTPWSKTCALFVVGKSRMKDCRDGVVSALSDTDPVVRETAIWSLFESDAEAYGEHVEKLRTDSSHIVLRTVRRLENAGNIGTIKRMEAGKTR